MTEPENFLSRWSRRKQEAEHDSDAQDDALSVERVPAIESDAPTSAAETSGAEISGAEGPEDKAQTEGQQEPQVDLSSLPPIESIGVNTDIGAFLQKGIPLELTRAALRRAWTTDPTIRDFIGIAENQWDFATGSDIPGFGPLEASDDVRRMVAELFQGKPPAAEAAPQALSQGQIEEGAQAAIEEVDLATDARSAGVPNVPSPVLPKSQMQVSEPDNKEVNIATQQTGQQPDSGQPTKRLHGRALPQ
jgi:hypothetical protein